MPERARFLRGMSSWIGFRQIGVGYERDARNAGDTKYPLRRMIRFASDAVTSFSTTPIRLVVGLGFVSVAALPASPSPGRSTCGSSPTRPWRLVVAARRRPLPRRRAAAQPRNHRAVRGSHLRRGQGAAALRRRRDRRAGGQRHVSRVLVTGGGGFRRLAPGRAARARRQRRRRGASPRLRPHVDGRRAAPVRRHDARARLPPRRRGRWHRRQPRQPRSLLVRQPDDGRARARAGAAARDAEARRRGHGLRVPEARHRCRSTRTSSGTAIPRRRTLPTAWPRRRSSSGRRRTGSSTGRTRSSSCRSNLYGPRDNFDLATSHVIPALIRKMLESAGDEVVLWGDGSPTPRVPVRR